MYAKRHRRENLLCLLYWCIDEISQEELLNIYDYEYIIYEMIIDTVEELITDYVVVT